MKFKALAVVSLSLFAFTGAFAAGQDACCAGMAKKEMKGKCDATFANLNLSAAQKSKMQKLAAECDKGGCNEQSMAKMEEGARKVLNKQQFAAWKSTCTGQGMGKKQS